MSASPPSSRRVLLVTGLSGAGKTSILHTLEDLGYATIDNLPLGLVKEAVGREVRALAIGVDARTRDFAASSVLRLIEDLRRDSGLRPELLFATASEDALLRRYTETRRRHPLAVSGRVRDGIVAESLLVADLRAAADLVVDTSELPSPALRRLIESRFGQEAGAPALTIALVSFAFPAGLPRDADMVFDARFLRNPHYVEELRPKTGLEPPVAEYIRSDPQFEVFFTKLFDLVSFLLPRFVQEGKRYATFAIGCTGGRHRSVYVVERLQHQLIADGWRIAKTHRELARNSSQQQPGLIDQPLGVDASSHAARSPTPLTETSSQ